VHASARAREKTAAPRNDRERSENMIHPRKPINLRGFTTCTRLTRMFVQGSLSHRAAVSAGNALFFSPREINSRYTVAPSIRATAFDARRSRVMNAARRSAADSAVIPRRDRPRRRCGHAPNQPGMLLSTKFNFKSPRAGPAGIISERRDFKSRE